MNRDIKYKATCKNGHITVLDACGLQEIMESNMCEKCNQKIVDLDPDIFDIECANCEQYSEEGFWNDFIGTIDLAECYICQKSFGNNGNICVVGSKAHQTGIFKSFVDRADYRDFIRNDRPDYWDIVVHFTSKNNLLSILNDKKINSYPTGYFKHTDPINSKAVCLTETPIDFAKELASKFGPFGIAFTKKDIISFGGGPALSLNPDVLNSQMHLGFGNNLKPFINTISNRFNFISEREWRLPGDLLFSNICPNFIIIPYQLTNEILWGSDWEIIVDSGWSYSIVQPQNLT